MMIEEKIKCTQPCRCPKRNDGRKRQDARPTRRVVSQGRKKQKKKKKKQKEKRRKTRATRKVSQREREREREGEKEKKKDKKPDQPVGWPEEGERRKVGVSRGRVVGPWCRKAAGGKSRTG